MKVGILGSGNVGQAIAKKLVERKLEVMIGTRSPERLADFVAQNPGMRVGSYAECAAFGEVVFNASKGNESLEMLKSVGDNILGGKILVDIANTLDFSHGMPPTLFVGNTDSLAEQIQRALPATKVIKAFNTMSAAMMVDPGSLAGGDHSLFLCGNDADAKARATAMFSEWFGWRDILDIGDLTGARATEALLPIWIRLNMKFAGAPIQFKIVRQ